MAIFTKREIIEALERLGQLAEAQAEKVEWESLYADA